MNAEEEARRRRDAAAEWARWKNLAVRRVTELQALTLDLAIEREAAIDPVEEFGWACREALVNAELDRRGTRVPEGN